jgi:hypothetical protein
LSGTGRFQMACSGTGIPPGQISTWPFQRPSWFQSNSTLIIATLPEKLDTIRSMSPPHCTTAHGRRERIIRAVAALLDVVLEDRERRRVDQAAVAVGGAPALVHLVGRLRAEAGVAVRFGIHARPNQARGTWLAWKIYPAGRRSRSGTGRRCLWLDRPGRLRGVAPFAGAGRGFGQCNPRQCQQYRRD